MASTHDKKDDLGTLGGRIRAVRVARGLKLGYCAQQIGVSRTSLGQWEADKVENPDTTALGRFTKLTDISLDWLVERKGEDPDLSMPVGNGKQRRPDVAVSLRSEIPEIAASLTIHAHALDLTPRAHWAIPSEVLELALNAEPSAVVIKRVTKSDDFGCDRGDYLLIDRSHDQLDEPGIYMVADSDGKSARSVMVVDKNGVLETADPKRSNGSIVPDTVLGRVIGILKPK